MPWICTKSLQKDLVCAISLQIQFRKHKAHRGFLGVSREKTGKKPGKNELGFLVVCFIVVWEDSDADAADADATPPLSADADATPSPNIAVAANATLDAVNTQSSLKWTL